MSNIIKIKGKLTTGAPALGDLQVREMCFVLPDGAFYIKKDAATIVGPFTVNVSTGDMMKSVYDTTNNGNADTADNALSLGGVAAASYATTAGVTAQINALIASAPGALDTLNELAVALGNDPNFAATITASLATKLDGNSTIDGGTF